MNEINFIPRLLANNCLKQELGDPTAIFIPFRAEVMIQLASSLELQRWHSLDGCRLGDLELSQVGVALSSFSQGIHPNMVRTHVQVEGSCTTSMSIGSPISRCYASQ